MVIVCVILTKLFTLAANLPANLRPDIDSRSLVYELSSVMMKGMLLTNKKTQSPGMPLRQIRLLNQVTSQCELNTS